jgi:prepilin-type N-terminal cleavage/methylation domain-containing protein
MKSARGFTLLELMVCMTLITILAGLGLSAMRVYRARGANAVAQTTLGDARTVLEGSLNDVDNTFALVSWYEQSDPGVLHDASARALLPNFFVPRNVKFSVFHDPTCLDSSCMSDALEVQHCFGDHYSYYTRAGDGVDVRMEVAGDGCS